MKPTELEEALRDNKNLRKCITRLEKQWQSISGSVQFKHRLHTGELVLDQKFYDDFDEAYKEREREQKKLKDALADQEYREYCRRRPPNDKQDDDQEDDRPRERRKEEEPKRCYKRNTTARW